MERWRSDTGEAGDSAVRVIRKELPEKAPAIPDVVLSRRSVVLVTGGAQGITGEIVRELAEKTKATFVLLGRSPAPTAVEPADTARLKRRHGNPAVHSLEIPFRRPRLLRARDRGHGSSGCSRSVRFAPP